MKKITLSLACIAIYCSGMAQSQRLVLAEEFTQASCGPCASQNPAFNTLLGNNSSKVVAIKYQTDWPGADPMNAQNPVDVATRVSYYAVNGVPHALLDAVSVTGASYVGAPVNCTQAKIDAEYAVPSPFTINLSHTFSADYDSVFITCVITASQAFTSTGALKAHVVMVEDKIVFTTAPGSNGEKTFENVMKVMYPSAAGTTLPGTWTSGQSQTITVAKPIPAHVYNMREIAIVAFVQSDGNKAVHQAAHSQPLTLPASTVDAGTTVLTGVPVLQCSPSFTPSVTIKNFAATTLTSCNINYQIDNGPVSVLPWTGSLASGATTVVALPAQTASAGGHTFTCFTSMPNGSFDFYPINNQKSKPFTIANSTGAAAPLTEGFSAAVFPPTGWSVNNPDNSLTWERITGAGGFNNSSECTKVQWFNIAAGAVDELFVQSVDFSSASAASLIFNVAYAQYNNENDKLEVKVSSNCGTTWTTVFTKSGTTLKTAPAQTTPFIPSASQWRAEAVNLNAYIGQSNLIVKFVATSAYGNNLYVDDINLVNGGVGISEANNEIYNVNIYPNPASTNATIQFNLPQSSVVNYTIVNTLGQVSASNYLGLLSAGEKLQNINLENLNSGLYYLTIYFDNNKVTKKISIAK